jgi:hypothetical protein
MNPIDWNYECSKMTFDYVIYSWDYPHSEAVGLAEALCADRLGWY